MSNSMTIPISATSDSRENLDRLLGELRPKLHRYCARMTGSVIDGEDVIQEAMLKALEAFPNAGPVANLEGWIFRIAHNAALDFLRRRVRRDALHSNEDAEMILDPVDTAADRQLAATSLRTFMRLALLARRNRDDHRRQYSRREKRFASRSRLPSRVRERTRGRCAAFPFGTGAFAACCICGSL